VPDDGHVLEVEFFNEVVQVGGEAAHAVAEFGLLRVAVAAHVVGRDAEAGRGKVVGLLAPFGCCLSPAGDEEDLLAGFWPGLVVV